MDIARPDIMQKMKRRRWILAGGVVVVVAIALLGLSRLKPAAPTVDRSTIWPDTVKRGVHYASIDRNSAGNQRTTTSHIFDSRDFPAGPSIYSTTTYCPAFAYA